MCPNITNLDIAIEDNKYFKKRGAYCDHFPFMDNATRLEMSQSDMFFNLSLSHISTLEILKLYFLYNHSSSIPSLGKQGSEENYGPYEEEPSASFGVPTHGPSPNSLNWDFVSWRWKLLNALLGLTNPFQRVNLKELEMDSAWIAARQSTR